MFKSFNEDYAKNLHARLDIIENKLKVVEFIGRGDTKVKKAYLIKNYSDNRVDHLHQKIQTQL